MPRYCSHTVILPDESRLDDFVVEVAGNGVSAYYPFAGEMHSTIYFDTPILLSPRVDLEGKTISLTQLTWALHDTEHDGTTVLYAYRLTPCPSCAEGRFTMSKL